MQMRALTHMKQCELLSYPVLVHTFCVSQCVVANIDIDTNANANTGPNKPLTANSIVHSSYTFTQAIMCYISTWLFSLCHHWEQVYLTTLRKSQPTLWTHTSSANMLPQNSNPVRYSTGNLLLIQLLWLNPGKGAEKNAELALLWMHPMRVMGEVIRGAYHQFMSISFGLNSALHILVCHLQRVE